MAKDQELDEEDKEVSAEKSEEEQAEGESGQEKGLKGKLKKLTQNKKKLAIVAGAVVLLAGGVGAAVFMGYIPLGKKEAEVAADGKVGAKGDKDGEETTSQPVYYSLPEFLVNLNSGGKQTSFLKMEISLELSSGEDVKVLEANMPRIQDSFNTYLRELRASDLAGSAGLYRLKEELMLRINQQIAPSKVNDILFKEILVQ